MQTIKCLFIKIQDFKCLSEFQALVDNFGLFERLQTTEVNKQSKLVIIIYTIYLKTETQR